MSYNWKNEEGYLRERGLGRLISNLHGVVVVGDGEGGGGFRILVNQFCQPPSGKNKVRFSLF